MAAPGRERDFATGIGDFDDVGDAPATGHAIHATGDVGNLRAGKIALRIRRGNLIQRTSAEHFSGQYFLWATKGSDRQIISRNNLF
jgi:hypothetical protein